ncbi:MAG: EAL domain-containing protein, partial [Acetobacteraceae bacterium]|nr:EAL domain-containing protein [Acetobacteraceae bacterium]
KIDQSFVREQHRDPKARAIVEAILAMSEHIGLTVTAEGVETAAQLTMLRDQGCPLIQGYLIGMPNPAHKALALLRENQDRERTTADLLL